MASYPFLFKQQQSKSKQETAITLLDLISEKMAALAKENMATTQKRQKTWYDQKAREKVRKTEGAVASSESMHLAKWQGSYEVTKQVSKVTHETHIPDRVKKHIPQVPQLHLKKNPYPMCRIHTQCAESTSCWRGSKFFSTLDPSKGSWQVALALEAKQLTTNVLRLV